MSLLNAAGHTVAGRVFVFRAESHDRLLEVVQVGLEQSGRLEHLGSLTLVAVGPNGCTTTGVLAADERSMALRLPATVAITGRLIDVYSGAGLSDASVRIERRGLPREVLAECQRITGASSDVALTDARGTFSLPSFCPGTYAVEFSAPGYASLSAVRDWHPTTDWNMGDIALEATGALRVQLLDFDSKQRPTLSVGRTGARVAVDESGFALLTLPREGALQHFSVWFADGSMMNIYKDGTIAEVQEVVVRVGGGSALRATVDGEPSPEVSALGEPSIRVRFASPLGYRADWNCELSLGGPFETEVVDAPFATVDLVALADGWPQVLTSEAVALPTRAASAAPIEVELRYPGRARFAELRGPSGAALEPGIFVELRRPHDPSRWLASAYTDNAGRVPWPLVTDPRLYCGGVFAWDPLESFFIDLELPNSPQSSASVHIDVGPSKAHRVRLVVGGEAWSSSRLGIVGRHTDQRWTYFETDIDGWIPQFELSDGSLADFVIEDERLEEFGARVAITSSEQVIDVHAH